MSAMGLCLWYVASLRQLAATEQALLGVNHNKAVARALIGDALEYRKRNPAIDPVLQAAQVLGPRVTSNAPASTIPQR